MLAALYANSKRDEAKRPEPYTWLDFFPEHAPEPEPMGEEQMLAAMELWARAGEG